MDGNVKRVFTSYFGIAGDPARRAVEQSLWDIAETAIADSTHEIDIARYTQGLMDLGATVCSRTRPRCDACPLASNCYARRVRSEEHTSELQSLMRISYAVFCLTQKTIPHITIHNKSRLT